MGNLSINTTFFHKSNEIVKTHSMGGVVLYSSMPASLYTRVGILSKVGSNYDISIFEKYSNVDLQGLKIIENEPSTEFITHYYNEMNQKNAIWKKE